MRNGFRASIGIAVGTALVLAAVSLSVTRSAGQAERPARSKRRTSTSRRPDDARGCHRLHNRSPTAMLEQIVANTAPGCRTLKRR